MSRGVHYFPPLTHLLLEDLRIVDGVIVDALSLGGLFRNLAEDDPFLGRAMSSGSYYDAVSFDDAVYRVFLALEADISRIPLYPQIVIDEFQDFCPLDVEFVRELARRSPSSSWGMTTKPCMPSVTPHLTQFVSLLPGRSSRASNCRTVPVALRW